MEWGLAAGWIGCQSWVGEWGAPARWLVALDGWRPRMGGGADPRVGLVWVGVGGVWVGRGGGEVKEEEKQEEDKPLELANSKSRCGAALYPGLPWLALVYLSFPCCILVCPGLP